MYLLFFLILVFFSFHYYAHPQTKTFVIARRIALSFFIGIAGLRYNLGVDFFVYNELYTNGDTLKELFAGKYTPQYELLYDLVCVILRTLQLDPQLFFLLFSTFSSVVLFFVIEKFVERKYFFFSLLIYYSFVYLFMEMQAVRQSLAAGILYVSFWEILRVKKLKAYLLVGVAAMFHSSALFFFLICPLLDKKIRISKQITALVISIFVMIFRFRWIYEAIGFVISFFPNAFFAIRLLGITTNEIASFERRVFVTFFVYLIIYFVFLYCNRKNRGYFLSRERIIAQNLFFYFLIFTSLFWELSFLSTRIGWYLLFGMALLLPQMIGFLKSSYKMLALSFILLFCIVPFRKFVVPDETTAVFVPYEGYIECNFFGVESTGRERAAKYASEVGGEFYY